MVIVREYGDRRSRVTPIFFNQSTDLSSGPSTPSKSRVISSESDSLKGAGEFPSLVLFHQVDELAEQANVLYYVHTEVIRPSRRPISPTRPTPVATGSGSASTSGPSSRLSHPLVDVYSPTTRLLHQILQCPLVV